MRQLLVVPVFNEVQVVGKVVEGIRSHVSPPIEEVLFIDDCSTDGSAEALDAAVAGEPWMRAVHRTGNAGYGAAMIDAFRAARVGGFEFVITMDCDFQHSPADLARFCGFDPDISVVSGSRYLPESGTSGLPAPADRVEINRRITARLNKSHGTSLTDAFCGFKRYRTRDLDPEVFQTQGYAFPLEFWAYAHFRDLSIRELAVARIYVTDDRSFGEDLDRRRQRLRYYLKTWRESEQRFEQRP